MGHKPIRRYSRRFRKEVKDFIVRFEYFNIDAKNHSNSLLTLFFEKNYIIAYSDLGIKRLSFIMDRSYFRADSLPHHFASCLFISEDKHHVGIYLYSTTIHLYYLDKLYIIQDKRNMKKLSQHIKTYIKYHYKNKKS